MIGLRPGNADAHDIAAQPFTPLRQRDVVGIAGNDHYMGEVGQPEHVLHGVDGQPDVGAVLAVGRGREQLNQVDGPADQLLAVFGIDLCRPVRVGPGQHQVPNDDAKSRIAPTSTRPGQALALQALALSR